MADTPVGVWQLVRDEQGNDYVLLRDKQGRLLSIAIGICEAAAIMAQLSQPASQFILRRPLTHDVMQILLEKRHARLEKVVIDNMQNGIYYATIYVGKPGGEELIDARPSDAIALVVRTEAPIFVDAEIMNEHAFLPGQQEDDNEQYFGEGFI